MDSDECIGELLYNAAQTVFTGKATFSVEFGTDKPRETREEYNFPKPGALSSEQTTERDGKLIIGFVTNTLTSFVCNVGEPVKKREQQEISELEVLPPGGIIASDGKLNGGIRMGMLMYVLHNVHVGKSAEKREQQEFPEPDQLEVLPPGGIVSNDGRLNE